MKNQDRELVTLQVTQSDYKVWMTLWNKNGLWLGVRSTSVLGNMESLNILCIKEGYIGASDAIFLIQSGEKEKKEK